MLKVKIKILFLNILSIGIAVLAIPILVLSCTGKQKKLGDAILERDSLPMMKTVGVKTLVSDSGITRYRINSEEWLVYDRKKPSYWAFEKGVYLEQFDSLFNTKASIKADTAYFYDKKKLWKLIGNVKIQNLEGEEFETNLLYWDQKSKKVYSDAKIKIKQPDKIIYAHGFDSNQSMTDYTMRNVDGVFYVDQDAEKQKSKKEQQTVVNDSLDTIK